MENELIGVNLNQETSNSSYISQIEKIKTSSQPSEVKLDLLDLVVRDFFRKKYHIKRNAEYEEMIDFFLERNKPNLATFCHEMIVALYSGDMANDNNIAILLEETKSMIEKENQSSGKVNVKNAFSTLMGKFGRKKKDSSALRDFEHISKQTSRIINKYIATASPLTDQIDQNAIMEQKQNQKSLIYELNPGLAPDPEVIDENEEYSKIRNIDDLERIKQKIKVRKSLVKDQTNS